VAGMPRLAIASAARRTLPPARVRLGGLAHGTAAAVAIRTEHTADSTPHPATGTSWGPRLHPQAALAGVAVAASGSRRVAVGSKPTHLHHQQHQ
jgi:photosystem II stability/assembly factor-like uncharacterized protein